MTTSQQPTQSEQALALEAERLRQSLASVIRQATEAIERMDAGQRPSNYMGGNVFNHDLDNATSAAARLDLLLNMVRSDDAERAIAIIKDPWSIWSL